MAVAFPVQAGNTPVTSNGINTNAPVLSAQEAKEKNNLLWRMKQKPKDSMRRFAYTNWLFRHDQPEEALRQTEILLRMEPRNTDYFLVRARILMRLDSTKRPRLAEAQNLLVRGIKISPHYQDIYRLLFQSCNRDNSTLDCAPYQLQAQKRFPSAFWLEEYPPHNASDEERQAWLDRSLKRVRNYLGKHPNDLSARHRYAQLLNYNKDFTRALQEFDRIIAKSPENGDFTSGKSTVLVTEGREAMRTANENKNAQQFSDGQAMLLEAMRISPEQELPLKALVLSCDHELNTRDCLPFKEQAKERYPLAYWWKDYTPVRNADGSINRPWLAERIEYVTTHILARPEDTDARYLRGRLYAWGKHFNAAMADYNHLLSLDPQNTDYLTGKAWVLTMMGGEAFRQGNVKTAQTNLTQAIDYAAQYEGAYRTLITTCRGDNETETCTVYRNKAATLFPDAFWWKDYTPERNADGEIDHGWLKNAVAELQTYLTTQPDDTEAKLKLAQILAWGDRNEEALAIYRELQKENPDSPDIKSGTAWVLTSMANNALKANAPEQAEKQLVEAIQTAPQNERAYRAMLFHCEQKQLQADDTDANENNTNTGSGLLCEAFRARADQQFNHPYWALSFHPERLADGSIDPDWLNQRKARLLATLDGTQQPLKNSGTGVEAENNTLREPDINAYYQLARIYTFEGNYPEALSTYETLLNLSPENQDFMLAKARLLIYMDEPKQSLATIQQFILEQLYDDSDVYLRTYNPDDPLALSPVTLVALADEDNADNANKSVVPANNQRVANAPDATPNKKLGEATLDMTPLHQDPNMLSEDGYDVIIRAQVQMGDWQRAKQTLQLAETAYPIRDWQKEYHDVIPHYTHELKAVYGYEDISNGNDGWLNQGVFYNAKFANNARFMTGISRNKRFNKNDFGLHASFSYPLTKHLTSITQMRYGPDNDVLADLSLAQGVSINLPWGFNAVLKYRMNKYDERYTHSGIYTLEKYWRRYRLAYSLFNNHIQDVGIANTHVGSITRYYNENSSIGLTVSNGQGLELLQIGNVLQYDTLSMSLRGEHFFTPKWGLIYALYYSRLEDLFNRKGIQLGIRTLL